MMDIEQVKLELKKKKDLKTNIVSLIELCIKKRTLIFEDIDGNINSELLIKENILVFISKKYSIVDNWFFAYLFYQKYAEILNFSISEDFQTTIKFLKDIESFFVGNTYDQRFSKLNRKLWAISIFKSHKKYKLDFISFLNSLSRETESDEVQLFIDGFSNALPLIDIKIDGFYKNLQFFLDLVKKDSRKNMIVASLQNGIRNKTTRCTNFGIEFFDYSIKQNNIENDILTPIISGLYSILGITFLNEKIIPLLDKDMFSVAIIHGLSNINTVEEKEAVAFLDIYDKLNHENLEILVNIPRFLFTLLKSEIVLNKRIIKTKCFNHLEKLITIDNSNLVYQILNGIEFLDKFNQEKTSLLIRLIEQPHFIAKKFLKQIGATFLHLKDIKCFEQILFSIAKYCPLFPVSDYLSFSINEFKNQKPHELEKLVIKLLIHNNGEYRFLGWGIFRNISKYPDKFTFTINILRLKSIDQYKLFVSICQNYSEPEFIIPCLLPLINSESLIVKEKFLCKLEEYSENYGKNLIDVLENSLNLAEAYPKAIYQRISSYWSNYNQKYIEVKDNINELNPYYSQNNIFTDYLRNHYRVLNQKIKKNVEAISLIKILCANVILAKGGGWKNEGDSSIIKLNKPSEQPKNKFLFPRCYYIKPEHFDLMRRQEMRINWDTYFKEIEDILSNE